MKIKEAPPTRPLGEQYLGYDVPDEFRPVEQFIIEHKATGWGDLIDLFIYATYPKYCTEHYILQTLPCFHPIQEGEEERRHIWNMAKEQLTLLPLGPKVLEYITKNRPDLA